MKPSNQWKIHSEPNGRKITNKKGGEQMKLSEYLKAERKKRCLTQGEMCKKIGVNRSTYCTYEKGWYNPTRKRKVKPSLVTAKRIAKVTGASVEFIAELMDNEERE